MVLQWGQVPADTEAPKTSPLEASRAPRRDMSPLGGKWVRQTPQHAEDAAPQRLHHPRGASACP